MSRKTQYSNKILKILAEKPAIPLDEMTKKIHLSPTPLLNKERGEGVRSKYALTRSIKNLVESGCIEMLHSDNKDYLKLTKKGKNKFNCIICNSFVNLFYVQVNYIFYPIIFFLWLNFLADGYRLFFPLHREGRYLHIQKANHQS